MMRARLMLFTLFTFGLAYGNPSRITRSVPGDPGDSHLILALLEWGGDRAMHLFSGYWDGPMFATGRDVMAYTDTFLPLTVPFHLLATVFGSRIVAFNVLYLVSWVICAEATYRLALRVVTSRRAALIAALAFTFSTIRLAGSNHFQLAWAGFIPLVFLALFRFRDRPSPVRGSLLAAALVGAFLTSAYYGVVLLVGAGAVVAWWALVDLRRGEWRSSVPGLAVLGGLLVATLLPVRHWYDSAKACTYGREFDAGALAFRPGNLLSAARRSTLLDDVPIVSDPVLAQAGGENHAYVGGFVIIGLIVLVGFVATRRRLPATLGATSEFVAIWAVALGAAAIAVGPLSAPFPVPYDLAVEVIPGIDAMLALGRLTIFLQLALVLTAAVGVAHLLDRLPPPRSWALVAVLAAVVAAEGLMHHPMLDVAVAPDGSVYDVLAELEAGRSVELPMPPRTTVATFAFIESTRMALGADDDVQTVNGYSGYAPQGYDQTVDALNSFPSSTAVAELRRLGVDYVVLHSGLLELGGTATLTASVDESGFARYQKDMLGETLRSLPAGLVAERIDATDGIVLVLTPGPDAPGSPACG